MIDVKWADEERNVLLWTFSLGWTWDDFFAAKQTSDHLIESVDGVVDSIILTSREQHIPPNAITNFRRLIANRHKRHDTIVLVGVKSFLASLVDIAVRFVPSARMQLHFAETQQEAYAIIQQRRQERVGMYSEIEVA